MRAVMDVGGACADGGPYVSAQPCPDGTPAAMLLGAFGLFGFGALGMASGARIGGYGWLPLLAWTGLFATLGWNFLDYGLVNPPRGAGDRVGLRHPRRAVPADGVGAGGLRPVHAPGRRGVPARLRAGRDHGQHPARGGDGVAPTGDGRRHASATVAPEHRVEVAGSARQDQLRAIDALMGAAVTGAAAVAPTELPESTQAMLDRLERLAGMRDRGLLTAEEYETAKDAVMHELEART